ncbi:hypothetical protein KSF_105350 [Reticulibacter mediterranei]|uniref:Uncharacterized protein n=1 Tax=Reticulibacter mediterranei TaxID=2778369 RepID=A0A8J3NAL4_9CHLR|nr:hypothetical protein KSF_105350 [Reticulibacter mediterranei]
MKKSSSRKDYRRRKKVILNLADRGGRIECWQFRAHAIRASRARFCHLNYLNIVSKKNDAKWDAEIEDMKDLSMSSSKSS